MPVSQLTPKLVIFDCDGVLVDSEPTFNRVLHTYLLSTGARLSLVECCNLFVGKSRHDVERYVSDRGLRLPEKWPQDFYNRVLDALRTDVTPIPGAREAVALISSAGIPLCVASNGLLAKMHVTLEQTGLLSWFEGKMYSAYDVGASKPAPDVFLHAAKMNGVAPENCVVVEDSVSGFEAAFNAAMTCFAYVPKTALKPDDLFGARRLTDMADLPKLLGL
ncbi:MULTISPECIES: HAD family hydrolase [Roseobacteraceae]|uniref:HAD family phosphatase n=1 Tax=Celeribacter baekdonensis TaxID=875171 RepID=A0A1G7T6L0_9RHOB|nr:MULTISPECIES: HAD family hydrolase [Roseobacteraceae]MBU0643126.1 HAD family hydrolase [Alphaproteobacteria bacterium]AVW90052.1 HAD family phosphatase [Celeribacter baekdonensis]KAB6717163.1 HAD family phosphatase [Roseobacter sp. TSBP12]MBU1280062.1 HAD family hydrolase [Alphaproteobacteria bacterium]MBU1830392.1 HAD family hydrolase [Alphaproteobacteria bacterium]